MTRKILTLFFVFFSTLLFGQAPKIQWQRCLGGFSRELVYNDNTYNSPQYRSFDVTDDNGFIIGATTNSKDGDITDRVRGEGDYDIWLTRLDRFGNTIWGKSFGTSESDIFGAARQTPDHGFIVIGTRNIDYDYFSDSSNIWVFKLSPVGEVEWEKILGGPRRDFGYDIKPTLDGGYILVGTATSIATVGSKDIWVAKLDDLGNITWQKELGGTSIDEANTIIPTADGGYLVGGTTLSNDGDVSGNHTGDNLDIWLVKLNSNGNIAWQRCYGGTGFEAIGTVKQTPDNGFILVGEASSSDGDLTSNHGGIDAWVVKTDSYGNIIWQKSYGNGGNQAFYDVEQLATGEYVFAGKHHGADGQDVSGTINKDYPDVWVVKTSNTGSILWQNCFGGWGREFGGSVVKAPDEGFFLLATTSSDDDLYDVQGNHGNYGTEDIWFAKLGSFNTVKGKAFDDRNKNGIKDPGESAVTGAVVRSEKPGNYKSSFSYNGNFANYLDTGNFVTTVKFNPYYISAPASKINNFASYNIVDSFDFALQPISKQRDLNISIIPLTPARANFELKYRIVYKNVGTDTITNGQVLFKPDKRIVFNGAYPSISSSNGDTLKWNFSNLKPFDTASIFVKMYVKPPPFVNIDNTLVSVAVITPNDGDHTPADDTAIIKHLVTGSYDPNDKTENLGGKISLQQVASGTYIDYLIRFQNTGNDTAFNVVIRDTLDSKLDWSSLEVIGSDHPYELQVDSLNQLTWRFKNILLVDSVHNEPESHGFISYRIKPKSNLVEGDIIKNSASIYFDFNLPVKTNMQETIVVQNRSDNSNLLDPTISSFIPASGGAGTAVTITGSHFTGATYVSFGSVGVASFVLNSDTSITAIVGSGGSGNVSIATLGGKASVSGFIFIPKPTITSFSATSGKLGSTITIIGTNFTGATNVSFGGIAAESFKVISATRVTAIVGTGGSGDVSITTPGGTATLGGFIYYPEPTIISFAPANGGTGSLITITGTNLLTTRSVSFGNIAASSFKINSPTSVTATVGAGASGNVTVTTVGGTATLSGFTFASLPTITSFTPTTGAAGSTITITGTNFGGATAVSFGGVAATSFTVNSSISITAVVGISASGNVSVTTAAGTSTLTGFTFIPAPAITSFTPASGATGASITITGTNFTGATEVSFGGTAATSFIVNSSTSITAVVGAGASGNVSVTTPGGTATLAGFTFTVVTAIDPVPANSLGIRFYPNPTTGSFVIDTLKLSDKWETLEIFDTQGKQKLSNFTIKNKTRVNVNVEYLSNGLYMAILKRKNGPSAVIKFLKL